MNSQFFLGLLFIAYQLICVNIRDLNIVIAVSKVNFTKSCGISKEDFEVSISFLPIYSTPNNDYAWAEFTFTTQSNVSSLFFCNQTLNTKHCYIRTEEDFPSKGILKIANVYSVKGIGLESFIQKSLGYKYKEDDYFCYSNYCLESEINYTVSELEKDNFHFIIPVSGKIDDDYIILINEQEIPCEINEEGNLDCQLLEGIIPKMNKLSYDIYSYQCGMQYKTKMKFVHNNANYIKINIYKIIIVLYIVFDI